MLIDLAWEITNAIEKISVRDSAEKLHGKKQSCMQKKKKKTQNMSLMIF